MAAPDHPTITIGELKRQLDAYPDDHRLSFNGLRFYRLKRRGPDLVQLEFDQTVYLDDKGLVVVENHQ